MCLGWGWGFREKRSHPCDELRRPSARRREMGLGAGGGGSGGEGDTGETHFVEGFLAAGAGEGGEGGQDGVAERHGAAGRDGGRRGAASRPPQLITRARAASSQLQGAEETRPGRGGRGGSGSGAA